MAKRGQARVSAAEQALKDRQVLDMRAAGATLQEVADKYYNGHRANAHRALVRITTSYVRDGVDLLREVENHRLDRLQMAHWSAAMKGHLGATKAVLSVMDRRAKLNGLDSPLETIGGGSITVVLDSGVGVGSMVEPDLVVDAPEDTAGE